MAIVGLVVPVQLPTSAAEITGPNPARFSFYTFYSP